MSVFQDGHPHFCRVSAIIFLLVFSLVFHYSIVVNNVFNFFSFNPQHRNRLDLSPKVVLEL